MTAVLCGWVWDHILTKNFICKFTYPAPDNDFDLLGKPLDCILYYILAKSVNLDDDIDDNMPKHGNKLPATLGNWESQG